MRLFTSLLGALALVLVVHPLAAQDDETNRKEELARELMAVTNAGDMGQQVVQQMIGQLKVSSPEVPEAFWDEFLAGFDAGKMEDLIVPIYVRHLTVEEMEAALAFYRTPEGQSLLRKMPAIMRESMQVGQEFGMEIARKAQQQLEAYEDEDSETP